MITLRCNARIHSQKFLNIILNAFVSLCRQRHPARRERANVQQIAQLDVAQLQQNEKRDLVHILRRHPVPENEP